MGRKIEKSSLNNHVSEHHHAEETVKLIFRGLIPIILLAGGLVLLALKIPGWSLLLGMPLTILGTVFLIYSYDEVVSKKFGDQIPPRLKEKGETFGLGGKKEEEEY